MGFRTGAFATVWKVEPKSDHVTTVQLSVSRKDRDSGEYVTDFSGFVAFIGSLNANNAAKLQARDRIKLGDVDVSTNYVAEKGMTYTNYKVFSFEDASGPGSYNSNTSASDPTPSNVDEGEVDDATALPF